MSEPLRINAIPTVHPDDTPGKNRGLIQAYKLRDFAAATAMALQESMRNPDGSLTIRRDEDGKPVDAAAVTALVKAWAEAMEAIRIIRGKPLPGSLKPERRRRVEKARPVVELMPVEPVQEGQGR